jgi:eukaryotic-like serine/threonine-protein kinase
MLCANCGSDTPHPATACQACLTPFPLMSAPAPESVESKTAAYRTGPTRTPGGTRAGGPLGPLTAGASFGPRYRILRELGAGGMGVVYQAWDAELGVAVALKVVRLEVDADPQVAQEVERRFKRELLLARQVTHKHVVRIHDLGEIDGIKYITMPYIEGRDLRDVLIERGRLTVPEALTLAKQIAAGLAAAHDAGVVHRDLKPENVMIDQDGHALIMDFGISRSVESGTATATAGGAIMGTLEYMAPEQARGVAVDHRADIYSFGLIVQDTLTGRRRVSAAQSALSEMMLRMQQQPPPLRTLAPDVPEGLEQIVAKCLTPDPDDRYATTRALVDDLESLDSDGRAIPRPAAKDRQWKAATATMLVLVLLSAGTAVWFAQHRAGPPPAAAAREPLSILIADFENAANDPVFDGALEQALGIAMEGAPFVTSYDRQQAKQVASRMYIEGRLNESAARLIAARESIKVILAGSITPEGSGYRIAVKAVDPGDGKVLAVQTERAGSKADVLQAMSAVAARMRGALGETELKITNLGSAESATAGSLEAMQAYARGQELARGAKYDEALKAYEDAVARDPQFGRAYAGMGVIYANFKQQDKAEAAYREAFKHVDRMTEREKYRTLGGYYNLVVGNYDKAIENYENLVRLYPADTGGHGNLALAYLNAGNLPKAIVEVRKVLEIYPGNRLQRYNYAMYSMYAGDFVTAAAEGTRILQATPSFENAYLPIALSNLATGKADAARDAYAKLERLSPRGFSMASLGQADLEMYFGRYKEALAHLTPGIAADQKENRSFELALKYAASAEAHQALGNRREAIAAADKAAALGKRESVLFSTAQVFLQTGEWTRAQAVADRLRNMLQKRTTAYADLIAGQAALGQKDTAEGLDSLVKSRSLFDSWFVRYAAGRGYAEAEHFPEALSELELALKRQGEATDMYFDDVPTLRYLPPVYYWLARTQEGLAAGVSAEARKNYQRYLDLRASATFADPLAADARRRLSR